MYQTVYQNNAINIDKCIKHVIFSHTPPSLMEVCNSYQTFVTSFVFCSIPVDPLG